MDAKGLQHAFRNVPQERIHLIQAVAASRLPPDVRPPEYTKYLEDEPNLSAREETLVRLLVDFVSKHKKEEEPPSSIGGFILLSSVTILIGLFWFRTLNKYIR
jgi:hypothetical protein